jgi:amidohydrolase
MKEKPLTGQIAEMKGWLTEIRQTLHRNPELMYEETETAAFVAQWLEKFGLSVRRGVAQTGVIGVLGGEKPGKTVAIRADMDALPIQEGNKVFYASRIQGKMHACGHDAHVAILLGVAKFFSVLRPQVNGNIKWIFQPAEEGGAGAQLMIEEGALQDPKVEAIFGAHVFPTLPMGNVGLYEREGLAATNRFIFTISGKGGHGAYPHMVKDPILAAGYLITQVQSIVSRNIDPLDSAVVSFGKINGGSAYNIIPDEVELLGTIRSLVPQVREEIKSRLGQMAQGISRSFGLDCHCAIEPGYPALLNDPQMSNLVAEVCSQAIGKENVKYLRPSMGGEDFAFFLEKVPGSYFRLGCRNEAKGIIHPLHSSLFDIDEDVLPFGVEVFVRIIDRYLGLGLT